MTYRLLAFDLDGTAAEDGGLPTPRVAAALTAARSAGLRVVLATGRSYMAARKYALALGLVDPLISSQGALVRELLPPQARLLKETLPIGPLNEFLDLAQEWDLDASLYGEDEYFVTEMRRSARFHDRWFGLPMIEVASFNDALRILAAKGEAPIKALVTAEPAEAEHSSRSGHNLSQMSEQGTEPTLRQCRGPGRRSRTLRLRRTDPRPAGRPNASRLAVV